MKTIFVTSYHSFIARNILQTEVLERFKCAGLRVVILVLPQKVDYFKKEFASDNVDIAGVDPGGKVFSNFVYFISVCLVSVDNLVIRSLKDNKRYFRFYLAHIIYNLCHRFFIFKKILRYFFERFMVGDSFTKVLGEYSPDIVFSTDVYTQADRHLLGEAKRLGIKTVGMVRSWDNVTTKGVLLAIPDKIIVPNEVLKEELWRYNKVDASKIYISGVPHYDGYKNSSFPAKQEFLKQVGLDPNRKTIFFAPAGELVYNYDGEILKLLQKLNNEGNFSGKVQFYVRFHPGSKSKLNGFKKDEDFFFDSPGLDLIGTKKQSEITEEDDVRLNQALYHCDVVLSVCSTISIDAAVFNKPNIVFSIKQWPGDDIKKFLKYQHFKKFLAFGLCPVANSKKELVEYINRYLNNSSADSEKRESAVRKYCYRLDGNSSKRVAEFILWQI